MSLKQTELFLDHLLFEDLAHNSLNLLTVFSIKTAESRKTPLHAIAMLPEVPYAGEAGILLQRLVKFIISKLKSSSLS